MTSPHSRYSVDSGYPQAKGVCDRCGFIYQHSTLQWQYEWQGPKLQNIRLLVCEHCYDTPQEGLRTIILPADPLPIFNPRQENYTVDCNPVQALGTSIGTMVNFAGLDAAFTGGTNKSHVFCAGKSISGSGYTNSVGRNWGSGITQTLQRFILYAPNDLKFLTAGSGYKIQGSTTGVVFTDLYAGIVAGTIGEIIDVTVSNGAPYQYHQVNFSGDGVTSVAIAQFVIYSANQVQEGDT